MRVLNDNGYSTTYFGKLQGRNRVVVVGKVAGGLGRSFLYRFKDRVVLFYTTFSQIHERQSQRR